MAKNYAYLRVSDAAKQDSSSQRERIALYAQSLGLHIDKWLDYQLSGSQTTKAERGLIELINQLKPGDRVLVNDIERLGRDSISDILEVTTRIINSGAELHFCLGQTKLTPEHKNDIAAFFITIGQAFAAQDFAKQRSLKAKAAAKRRQRQGLSAGRAKGAIIKSRLDKHENQILFWLSQDLSRTDVARRVNCSVVALSNWLDRRDELICQARDLGFFEKGMSLSLVKQRLKQHKQGQ
jgi:hypothetical protein